jgi:DNA-binding transcriptional regulator YiaG
MADEAIDVKSIREAFGENQSQFARRLGTAPNTVNGWERNGPPKQGVAAAVLRRLWEETADARKALRRKARAAA